MVRDLLRVCGILGAVWLGARVGGILICEAVRFWGKEERKSMDSVPSNAHGNLDEQISQLMQCKPLSEQEVLFLRHDFRFFFFLLFSGGSDLFVLWFSRNVTDRVRFVCVCAGQIKEFVCFSVHG